MADRTLNYRIAVNAAAGTAGIRDFSRAVTRELRNVDDSLTDTATASDRVVRSINALADQAETELRQAARAADAFAQALGPELAAKLGQAGIAERIGELNRMGLSFEDIEANADELVVSLQRLDDVQLAALDQGLGNLGGKARTVGDEADRSRSVLANMVGNSAQSISGLSGVVGDLGVAIGQLGEYATEGGISMRGLAGVAGPMAGLAAVTAVVSSVLEGINFERQFRAEQVDRWVDALRDGVPLAQALADSVRETGEISTTVAGGGFAGLGRHARDLTGDLERLDITLEEFNELVQDPRARQALRDQAAAILGTKISEQTDDMRDYAKSLLLVADGADQVAGDQAKANAEFERTARITKPSTDEVARAVEAWTRLRDPVAAMPAEFQRVADALAQGTTPAASDMDRIMDELGLTYDDVFDAAQGLNDKLDDQEGKLDDVTSAADRTKAAFSRLRDNLNFEAALNRFNYDFLVAIDKVNSGVGLTADEIVGLKDDIITVGEFAKLNPIEVQAMLDKIDQGDIQGAFDDAQRAANKYKVRFQAELYWAQGTRLPTPDGRPGPPVGRAAPPDLVPVPAGRAGAGAGLRAAGPDVDGWTPNADVSTTPVVVPFAVPAVGVPVALNLDLRGAILGSRYDVVRTIRSATRDGLRLAGSRS